MKFRRIFALLTAAVMTAALPQVGALTDIFTSAVDKTAADYTYEITPMLSPFNQYFYVKTDNPDPMSFRFADKSSVYAQEGSYGSIDINYDSWNDKVITYPDVVYENESTGRVKGGYIFAGNSTDGGEVTLQKKVAGRYSWDYTYEDTNIKLTLPKLKSNLDYLIDTYATKDNFFDNLDAIQSGFSSICLYSGSYIRGDVTKAGTNWYVYTSPHIDQSFYIGSPYTRSNNQRLFASVIYPYQYDSLGFPSMMVSAARKLNSEMTYAWSQSSHAYVNITLNGETKTYGGQGNGKGQGIDKSDIIKSFDISKDTFTLDGSKQLLKDYAALDIPDDVPHEEDELTWGKICDTVGSEGSWVRTISGYSYLYCTGAGKINYYFSTENVGAGGSMLWSGALDYASGIWVDGRFVNKYENWVKGAKLEDNPTSSVLLTNVEFFETDPNYSSIKDVVKNVIYYYDSDKDWWEASTSSYMTDSWWYGGKAGYDYLKQLVDEGKLDAKYLKNMILTREQIEQLIEKNSDSVPKRGYIYDATVAAGTPFYYAPAMQTATAR